MSPGTNPALSTPLPAASSVERIFPTLTPAQVARIAAQGTVRPIQGGEVLIEAEEPVVPFFVVKTGRIMFAVGEPWAY